ncbi:MAG: hypothetical protein ACR2IP_04295 [Solirubrobacteraceae bacterium]
MSTSSAALRTGGVTRTLWRLTKGLPSGRQLLRGIVYRFIAAMCLGIPVGLLVKVGSGQDRAKRCNRAAEQR